MGGDDTVGAPTLITFLRVEIAERGFTLRYCWLLAAEHHDGVYECVLAERPATVTTQQI